MADRQGDANEVVEQFQAMQREADSLWGKINEFDLERQEHDLVLKTLRPLDPQRRCFRLVGGVLVERSVEEVAPALERHKQALEQARVGLGWASLAGARRSQMRRNATRGGVAGMCLSPCTLAARPTRRAEACTHLESVSQSAVVAWRPRRIRRRGRSSHAHRASQRGAPAIA